MSGSENRAPIVARERLPGHHERLVASTYDKKVESLYTEEIIEAGPGMALLLTASKSRRTARRYHSCDSMLPASVS